MTRRECPVTGIFWDFTIPLTRERIVSQTLPVPAP
jgi:hypothetical protein